MDLLEVEMWTEGAEGELREHHCFKLRKPRKHENRLKVREKSTPRKKMSKNSKT